MGSVRHISDPKREPNGNRFPSRDPDQLALEYLRSQCGALFRRGFQLVSHRRQLYVRAAGTKIPLRLDLAAGWQQVQGRCAQLQELLAQGGYDARAWDETTLGPGIQAKSRALDREQVITLWRRRKLAEGCSEETFRNNYETYLRRLDERQPLHQDSVLRVIESLPSTSPRRRRLVRTLRQVAAVAQVPWNGALLDPLEGARKSLPRREIPYFTDGEIEAIVLGFRQRNQGPWWRVTATLAIYGLRPWELWVAVPDGRPGCLLVPQGKKNSSGVNPPRTVPPFHPEWLELFDLKAAMKYPLPRRHASCSAGGMITTHLNRSGLLGDTSRQRSSYGFRHAYAHRMHSPRYRATDAHGAVFMGHTVPVHNRAYRQWIRGLEDPLEAYGFTSPGGE